MTFINEKSQYRSDVICNKDISQHVIHTVETISKETEEKLLSFVNDAWSPCFKKLQHEYPWAGLKQGVIRVDMTANNEYENIADSIYEIETNPEGWHALFAAFETVYGKEASQGYTNQFTQKISRALKALNCKGFINLNPEVESDKILAKRLGLDYHSEFNPNKLDGLWWIRTPHVQDYMYFSYIYELLANHSVVDVYGDSRKDYLIDLELAKGLKHIASTIIDFYHGMCVKPIFGTRSRNTLILKTYATLSERRWFFSKIQQIFKNDQADEYIMMPYIAPKEVEINGAVHEVIWRLYLVWNPETNLYEYLGGITTANPKQEFGQAIHGSKPDAVFWPIQKQIEKVLP